MGFMTERSKKTGRRLTAVPDLPTDRPEVETARLQLVGPGPGAESVLDARRGMPGELLPGMLAGWRALLHRGTTPLDAEVSGYEFLAMFRDAASGQDTVGPLVALLADAEQTRSREALAMARVLAQIGPDSVRSAAAKSAHRLATAGLRDMPWVALLGKPQWLRSFGFADPAGGQQTIAVEFGYGKKKHAVAVLIDHRLGGGVKDCWLTADPARLSAQMRHGVTGHGLQFHDYTAAAAATILGAALAAPPCPAAADQIETVGTFLPLLRNRFPLIPTDSQAMVPAPSSGPVGSVRPPTAKPLGHASPIHRLKVTLDGSKPPIWRRLEVPSSVTLDRLHEILLTAFEWSGGHPWVFETPDGEFGDADPETDIRSAKQMQLGTVASAVGSKLTYTYDFGDDWRHVIVVEAIAAGLTGQKYPRCTAGRKAAPPEGSGGIWGYLALCGILADPAHPEHLERLEWLGLESAADFDRDQFDMKELNTLLQH